MYFFELLDYPKAQRNRFIVFIVACFLLVFKTTGLGINTNSVPIKSQVLGNADTFELNFINQ